MARALASDPNILLMDEPFGAVDPIVRADLQVELNRLQRELGKTIVFVTHDIDEAFVLADQVVIFRKGGVDRPGRHAGRDPRRTPPTTSCASFIGADKGKRDLSLQQRRGRRRAHPRRRRATAGRSASSVRGRLASDGDEQTVVNWTLEQPRPDPRAHAQPRPAGDHPDHRELRALDPAGLAGQPQPAARARS